MLRFAVTTTALFLTAAPALAGGVAPTPAPPPVIVPVAEEDWTGAYVGAQFDYIAQGELLDGPNLLDLEGQLFGIFGGYRYDLGDFVIGGEIDYMMGTGELASNDPQLLIINPDIDMTLLRAGLEAGFDAGPALIYGTAGYAHITLESAFTETDSSGYFFGAGIDYRLSERITVGAEVLQHNFNDFDLPAELDMLTIGLNVAFTF